MLINDFKSEKLYKKIFQSESRLVLLVFYTEIFKPSIEQIKVLEQLEFDEKKLEAFKINYDNNKDLSKQFEVITLPTIIFFRNGKEVSRLSGSQTKRQLNIIMSTL